MRIISVARACALGSMLILVSANAVAASTIIDTASVWTGQGVAPLGGNGVSAYGQSFIAPDDPVLHHITLYLDEHWNPYLHIDYEVIVMGWAGDRADGNVLFRSDVASTDGVWQSWDEVSVDTGGINLTPGEDYIVFISTIGHVLGIDNTARGGFIDANVYPGGHFWYQPGPWTQPFSAVTDDAWIGWEDSEFAVTLVFEPVPEPTTVASFFVMVWACGGRRGYSI